MLAFGLFALVTSPVGIVAAAVLTGFAGALFNPAVRAYLSREAGEGRAGAFAVFNTAADAGAFAGPLVGAALPTAVGLTPAAVLPVLAGAVVFTLGIALANPFTMQLLPVLGSERLLGTYFGSYFLVSAVVSAAVSAAVGALLDMSGPGWRAVAPLVLCAVGLAGAAGTLLMQRRGLLS